ncbi:MAG: sulfotransferase family protein, partial [Candidatus Binatia bacterium]
MKRKTFLFVGGIHRSGTSLLHEIIQSHPQVSGIQNSQSPENEGQHLQSVFPTARSFGGPGRFGFDERSFMDERHPLATTASAKKIFKQWSPYWDLRRRYLVEKSPPNLVRTRFFQALFRRSLFIIILRHPVAVAYATEKMSGADIASLIEHTLLCYERFLSDLPHLEQCFVLRYEDFVANPKAVMDEVFRFAGLDPAPIHRQIRADVNEKYFKKWENDKPSILTQLPPGCE